MSEGGKVIGYAPRVFDDITIYKHPVIEPGCQVMWKEGVIVMICRIGETVPRHVTCDSITLHPADYEMVVKSYMDKNSKRQSHA
jgi:hypothetical protein